ncbi:hypothetical protein MMC18_008575 [Xylographa bjoerkii]|nr:hypothetical protein [Xylographa bjoerkii]
MNGARCFWYCAHCSDGPYSQEINDFCLTCHVRQDGYAQDIVVGLPEQSLSEAQFQPFSCPKLSRDAIKDDTVDLQPAITDRNIFQKADSETESPGPLKDALHRYRTPDHHVSFQEGSLGLVEKCIFNLNDSAPRAWVSHSRTIYPGQSCFSLETGEPATAPKKWPYSPVRKAEVAFVRGRGACDVCKKRKKACRHRLDICQQPDPAGTKSSEPLPTSAEIIKQNDDLAQKNRHRRSKQVPAIKYDRFDRIGSSAVQSSSQFGSSELQVSNRGSRARTSTGSPDTTEEILHSSCAINTIASEVMRKPKHMLLSQPGSIPTPSTKYSRDKRSTALVTTQPTRRSRLPPIIETATSEPPEEECAKTPKTSTTTINPWLLPSFDDPIHQNPSLTSASINPHLPTITNAIFPNHSPILPTGLNPSSTNDSPSASPYTPSPPATTPPPLLHDPSSPDIFEAFTHISSLYASPPHSPSPRSPLSSSSSASSPSNTITPSPFDSLAPSTNASTVTSPSGVSDDRFSKPLACNDA